MTTLTAPPPTTSPLQWKWSRERFYLAIEAGVIGEDEKVELIGGQISAEGMVDRVTQKTPHVTAVGLCQDLFTALGLAGCHVRVQVPLSLTDDTEPEPDLAIVSGLRRNYADHHPTSALLVVEVAEATLRYDRTVKASLYASAGIPDYWIVNLAERVLEVHREPVPDTDQPFGARYGTILRLAPERSLAPVASPEHEITVSALLP